MTTLKRVLALAILTFAISFTISGQTKDWAKFSRYAEKNTIQTGKVDVVFMGDSNTEIWYRDHPAFYAIQLQDEPGYRHLKKCAD